jgi:4-aminobutyrate aminotransferase
MISRTSSSALCKFVPALTRSNRLSTRPFSTSQRTSSELAAFGEQHIAKGIGRLTKHVFEDGKGTYITTDKGVKLLDLTSGIGVVNLGHCHPKVSAAAAAQCSKITHAQVNIGFSSVQIALIKELLPILPHPSLDTVFFWNSGAEAVEAAVKLSRAATKKPNIIVMQGSYHGRTNATAAMTRSKTIYGEGHGPLMGGVFVRFVWNLYEPCTDFVSGDRVPILQSVRWCDSRHVHRETRRSGFATNEAHPTTTIVSR